MPTSQLSSRFHSLSWPGIERQVGLRPRGRVALDDGADILDAMETLLSWEGRMVRSALLLVGKRRFQMQTFEAFEPAMQLRWQGKLRHVICRPSLDACRRFHLRPQRLRLIFDNGAGIDAVIEHVHESVLRGSRLALAIGKDLRLVLEPM